MSCPRLILEEKLHTAPLNIMKYIVYTIVQKFGVGKICVNIF